ALLALVAIGRSVALGQEAQPETRAGGETGRGSVTQEGSQGDAARGEGARGEGERAPGTRGQRRGGQRRGGTRVPVASRESNLLRGAYGTERANNDLLYYHLDIRVDPEKKTIAGKNTIRFKMLEDGSRIYIYLRNTVNVDKN